MVWERVFSIGLIAAFVLMVALFVNAGRDAFARNRAIGERNRRVVKECKITNVRRLEAGKYQDIEAKWKCPDGSEFWLQAPTNEWTVGK